jgi:hypothetical protein
MPRETSDIAEKSKFYGIRTVRLSCISDFPDLSKGVALGRSSG